MSAAETILSLAGWMALALLAAAFLLTVWRVVKGPTLPDRVVALDMLVGIVIGFIALIAIRTGFTLYIDIAIALGLVGFLATVAFARFIMASSATRGAPAVAAAPVPIPDAEPAGAAERGSQKKSSRKSTKATLKAMSKTSAKAKGLNDEVAFMPTQAKPVKKPAGKSGAGANNDSAGKFTDDPQSKSANKSANKSASKSANRTEGKAPRPPAAGLEETTGGKAAGKVRKPEKGK